MDLMSIPKVKKNKTITVNDLVIARRKLHALSITLIPSIGFIITVILLLKGNTPKLLDLGLLIGMWCLTFTGVSVGFHRYFTHRAFKINPFVKIILAILGCMAGQGTVIYWASLHRRHHENADLFGDPHSPHLKKEGFFQQLRGLWHAHINWMLDHEIPNPMYYALDLTKDKSIKSVDRFYFLWLLLGLIIPTVIGGMVNRSWQGLLDGFLWGGMVRLFIGEHLIWSVNSICHTYGRRLFATSEYSTNNIWLSIPTFGEAWHNNHHAFPNSAKFGLYYWQLDLGYWVIRILEVVGLVWEVRTPTPQMIEAKKIKQPQTL